MCSPRIVTRLGIFVALCALALSGLNGVVAAQPPQRQAIASDARALLAMARQAQRDESAELAVRARMNQTFTDMLEAIRANKGVEEDKAKKVQALLQQIKDASAAQSDYINSLIDLLRSINQKVSR
jgi:tRNA C32,U32 (ribose-2'-O)-methylase TrmJ